MFELRFIFEPILPELIFPFDILLLPMLEFIIGVILLMGVGLAIILEFIMFEFIEFELRALTFTLVVSPQPNDAPAITNNADKIVIFLIVSPLGLFNFSGANRIAFTV